MKSTPLLHWNVEKTRDENFLCQTRVSQSCSVCMHFACDKITQRKNFQIFQKIFSFQLRKPREILEQTSLSSLCMITTCDKNHYFREKKKEDQLEFRVRSQYNLPKSAYI